MNYTAAATLAFQIAEGKALDSATLAVHLQQLFPQYTPERLNDLAAQLTSGNLTEKLEDVLLFRGPSTDGMGGWRK